MDEKELWNRAVKAREHSYSPYSGFAVGAALLCDDGTVFTGCNIENAAYGPTNCAERTAFFSAVAAGHRKFRAIAVAGGTGSTLKACYPCGVCRQVMAEFCERDTFQIVCGKSADKLEILTLAEILPKGFVL